VTLAIASSGEFLCLSGKLIVRLLNINVLLFLTLHPLYLRVVVMMALRNITSSKLKKSDVRDEWTND
jgi:hypothetical protein